MIERAHPMVTGFFRMKHRASRRSSFPLEGRLAFGRRRTREIAHVLREYGMLYLEMQELWLRTRIRRQDYAFLGDLRKLASRSMQDVKVNWGRVHQVMAERTTAWRESRGAAMIPERGVLAERLDAMRLALGSRADAAGEAIGQRAAALGASVTAIQATFADLRIRRLPPLRRCGWPCRVMSRLNVFSIDRLEARGHLREVLGAHLVLGAPPALLAPQPRDGWLEPGARYPPGPAVPGGDGDGTLLRPPARVATRPAPRPPPPAP